MAVISKILTSTLTAGTTYVTFTDSDIPNSLIRVFADDPDLMYQTVSLTGNTLTLTYEAQASNKSIALDVVKQGLEVIDALDSTEVAKALSANQGRILKTYIDNLPTPVYDISELDDVEITEITDGQVLAWDEDLQKFINVDQSGGGSIINYSTTEQDTGIKWINGKPVYQKVVDIGSLPNSTSKLVAHNISNMDFMISLTLSAKDSSGTFLTLPFVSNSFTYQVSAYVSGENIKIDTFSNRSGLSGYAILLYTKTTDSADT